MKWTFADEYPIRNAIEVNGRSPVKVVWQKVRQEIGISVYAYGDDVLQNGLYVISTTPFDVIIGANDRTN